MIAAHGRGTVGFSRLDNTHMVRLIESAAGTRHVDDGCGKPACNCSRNSWHKYEDVEESRFDRLNAGGWVCPTCRTLWEEGDTPDEYEPIKEKPAGLSESGVYRLIAGATGGEYRIEGRPGRYRVCSMSERAIVMRRPALDVQIRQERIIMPAEYVAAVLIEESELRVLAVRHPGPHWRKAIEELGVIIQTSPK